MSSLTPPRLRSAGCRRVGGVLPRTFKVEVVGTHCNICSELEYEPGQFAFSRSGRPTRGSTSAPDSTIPTEPRSRLRASEPSVGRTLSSRCSTFALKKQTNTFFQAALSSVSFPSGPTRVIQLVSCVRWRLFRRTMAFSPQIEIRKHFPQLTLLFCRCLTSYFGEKN